MIELLKSLFFNISSIIISDIVIKITCIMIGVIYIYIKYNFRITYMPRYLYYYDKDNLSNEEYQEILRNYETSVFIMTIIEGTIIMILLIQYFISPSISIEISQSRGSII